MKEKLWLVRVALAAAATVFGALSATAAGPATPALAAVATAPAIPVVRETITFAQEVAAVPKTAAEVLLLPMGVVECVLSPLPGVEVMSGLRHIGQGILAPFRFIGAVVSLPCDAVKAAAGAVNSVPQAAGLPAVVPAP